LSPGIFHLVYDIPFRVNEGEFVLLWFRVWEVLGMGYGLSMGTSLKSRNLKHARRLSRTTQDHNNNKQYKRIQKQQPNT